MGRNKPAYTGHNELKTSFQRKGAMLKIKNRDIRLIINYKQIEYKQDFGYIYEIEYDGNIHYNVFIEKYYATPEGATFVLYPGDEAFKENEHQWAWTTRTLDEAKEILETFECVFE